jgi:site-specific DNA-methyltransferase (adenine-specific)
MRVPHRPNAFHSLPTGAGLLPWQTTPHGRIVKADAEALLMALVDESVDLIIVDPAYESLEKWRAMGSTTRLKESKGSSNKWFQTFPNVRYWDLFREMYRVLKKGTHLYMFCDEETRDLVTCGYSPQTDKYIEGGVAVGPNIGSPNRPNIVGNLPSGGPLVAAKFKYWKGIIWDKLLAGMGYHYRARHEFILMAEKVLQKGKHRRLNDAGPADVIGKLEEINHEDLLEMQLALAPDIYKVRMLKGAKFYPTEKPYELIKLLVEQSTNPGDTVLDPMCGSGVVGEVCRDTGRRYILGDLDTDEAARRLL